MSIINDALKKAEKEKQIVLNKPAQILNKMGEIKTDAEKYILKRWLIWTGAIFVCILGAILVIIFFKRTTDKITTASSPTQETISQIEIPTAASPLRKIDVETPLLTSNFNLNGILYDKQKPLALINGRIVGEGTFINEAQLLEIQPTYVRLTLRGKEFLLKIK